MPNAIRGFLLFEGVTFVIAALIHFGVLMDGYTHHKAGIAESVIATVLLGGLLLTLIMQNRIRQIASVVQGFALLGTLVGVFTIIVGVGPRTIPDILYHIGIIAVLLWGIIVAREKRQREAF